MSQSSFSSNFTEEDKAGYNSDLAALIADHYKKDTRRCA
jgi:hypothetical protein